MAYETRSERPPRRGRVDDSGGDTEGGKKLYYHLTLLAETDQGYRNLIQLASLAFMEGYYYKPRMDWELLARYHEGLIATTGCLGGHVLQSLLQGDEKGALSNAGRLQEIFGKDNLFVELQDHGLQAQRDTNPKLIEIARKIGAPLIATNDSHYVHREDHEAHDALLCVQTGRDAQRSEAIQVRGARALPQDVGGDALPVPRLPRGMRQHAVGRRARRRQHRVRQAAAAQLPDPGGVRRRRRLPRPPRVGGCQGTVGRRAVSVGRRANGLRVAGHQEHGLRLATSSSSGTSSSTPRTSASASGPVVGRPPAVRLPTACGSPTSTRSSTTCCSSASSTRAASRCPTSTWTSTRDTATR